MNDDKTMFLNMTKYFLCVLLEQKDKLIYVFLFRNYLSFVNVEK